MKKTKDILLSQRFLPEPGGSIRWMYEVYRRWPTPVDVITHDYYKFPAGTPEYPTTPEPPNGVDHVTDAALRMDRRDIFLKDWGIEDPRRLLRYIRMTRAVKERFADPAHKDTIIRVHCTHAVPEVASLIPLRRRYGMRLQVICYAHGEEITACRASRQLRFLMNRANGIVDLMLANSTYTTSVLNGYIDPNRVHVMNPGVDLGEFSDADEAGNRWRRDAGYDGRVVVLTVGRMDPRKNHMAVLEAVGRLAGRHPELVYVAAGQGRQMDALRRRAQELGLMDRVSFPGTIDNETKLAMFGGCDVFAMPAVQDGTDVEGFGMVFLEAAACGKPSVAGNVGGQAEAVLHGKTGYVVDGRDVSAVTEAIGTLLSDPQTRQRLGHAGRMHAEAYDWQRVVQRTVELVEKLE